jgi:glutamate formiminotransferase
MLECVVNLSEGRDAAVLDALKQAAGPSCVDVHSDAVHNRSVFTMVDGDTAILEAAVRALAAVAVERLDIRSHQGVHPRLGVVDVVPFVPLGPPVAGGPLVPPVGPHALDEAIAARDRFVTWLAALGVPCFAYGPERTLPEVRRRAFRDLDPTAGPREPHVSAGACCVGARPVLVAYNVVIDASVERARAIAAEIRSASLRVLGLDLGDSTSQVSFNLVTPFDAGPTEAYDLVADRARVVRAELVGLLPLGVLEHAPEDRWAELKLSRSTTIEARLRQTGGRA